MAYQPNQSPTWTERDGLDPNDSRRIIKGADFGAEFDNIKTTFDALIERTAFLTTCKYNGSSVTYGYNTLNVESLGGGAWRVNFAEAINTDGDLSAGDFAAVVTPYTTNNRMVIGTITDQRETYVDIAFRELNGDSWEAPSTQGFAFVLIDQVPA